MTGAKAMTRRRRRSIERVMILASVVLLAGSAGGAEFHVEGDFRTFVNGGQTVIPYSRTDDFTVGDEVIANSGNSLVGQASSIAAVEGLRAHAFAAVYIVNGDIGRQANARARATYFDVVITGPPGQVTTSFNMHLSGQRDAGSSQTSALDSDGGVNLLVAFHVNGAIVSNIGSTISGAQFFNGANASQPTITTEVGVLVGWRPPAGVITSPTFTVDVGAPFTLQITLDVAAGAGAQGMSAALAAFGNGDFGNTLRFVSDGPVFNLPAGYTVSSTDAGITDNRVPCTSDCTQAGSTCDAGKLGCIAKRQACLLKIHATAEKKGIAPDAAALRKCADAFDGGAGEAAKGCIGKLEAKQKPAKPKTRCSATGDAATLATAIDAFVTGAVAAIDPGFPTVGAPNKCDAGKKACVLARASCILKEHARAGKKDAAPDAAKLQACSDTFDGGTNGVEKGCIGKLEAKQNIEKPATICAVTGDVPTLAAAVDGFVGDIVDAVHAVPAAD